jgi:serine/threonine protein kinase/tetratricopeptide (TPR) repeat protein
MARRWRRGERPLAEDVLAPYPDLAGCPETVLQLICEEICLRQESGEPVSAAEFLARFPQWQEPLQVLLGCHRLFTEEIQPPQFPQRGETIGGFELLAELGRGACSRVFLASQQSLSNRLVVVKVVPPETAEHFCLARLQHTHIVPLYSTHLCDGPASAHVPEQFSEEPSCSTPLPVEAADGEGKWLLLCMPYFGSKTLAGVLAGLHAVPPGARTGKHLLDVLDDREPGFPPLPRQSTARKFLSRISYVSAVCWIGTCVAEALHFAHERELVHLDIKPSNILLTSEAQPMLLDFHLAQPPLRPAAGACAWLGGTRPYMSPEQVEALTQLRQGQPVSVTVDARSDIYSLGVLLCEALGAEVTADKPCAVPNSNPQVSRGLADILARCLDPDPDRRYATAVELAEDLRRHLNDLPLRGVPNRSLAERWRKWRRRCPHLLSRYLLAVLIGSLAVFGGLVVMHSQTTMREVSRAATAPTHERALVAGHLHALAEQLRRQEMAGFAPGATADRLDRECRAVWDRREEIRRQLGRSQELDADLLDIVLLANELRLAAAAPGQVKTLHQQALDVLEQAEHFFGPNRLLLDKRRWHAQALGDTMLAADLHRRAAALAPGSAWEHYRQGRAFLQERRHDRASAELAQALELDPGCFWFHFHYGVCQYRLGRTDEAAAAFTACIALSSGPERAQCYVNRALAYTRAGKNEKALQDYDQALALEPGLAAAALNRGVLQYQSGRYTAALADLQEAMRLGAEAEQVLFNLALVHQARHEKGDALRCLNLVLQRNPAHKEAARLHRQLQGP